MDEPLSTEPYKGVRDFYPADWARMTALFSKIRETLASWGYQEYNASPLERAELYEAKTSEEIVSEQTYTFTDRGDRQVTLRPEMTPTLARMIAARRRGLAFPLRWFSIPNVFRYERPQKGRLREHYQLNVDLVGIASSEADIEIITVASELVKAFGAKDSDFTIRINSRALLTKACADAGLDGENMRNYLRLLDKKSKMSADEFDQARQAITSTDPLPLVDSTGIESFVTNLKERGIGNAVFDPTLTRGFDYYTGIVFEIFDTDPANARSIFGGGRFDKLVALFSARGGSAFGGGGDPIPAVGFGMGDVTFLDFLETHGLVARNDNGLAELYIGTPSEDDIPAAQSFAQMLRGDGIRTFVNLTDRALGDQIKDAVKRGIPYFVAYGADEVATGSVRMKTLLTSEETALPASELASRIRSGN